MALPSRAAEYPQPSITIRAIGPLFLLMMIDTEQTPLALSVFLWQLMESFSAWKSPAPRKSSSMCRSLLYFAVRSVSDADMVIHEHGLATNTLHHQCITGRSTDEATSYDSNLHESSYLSIRAGSVCLPECLLDARLVESRILRRNVR
jgi:hypothetical protein